jgi:hypothetical protein
VVAHPEARPTERKATVDSTSLAHQEHLVPEEASGLEHVSSIVARCTPDYVWRGRGLFGTYREDLQYIGSGKWLIPSGTSPSVRYEARVGTRPERDRCECTGFRHHHHCSHVVCAKLAHRKSAICDGCGERRWWRLLEQVTEDDELLSWFPGDVLCSGCIDAGLWA